MSNRLIINNRVINKDIISILSDIRRQGNTKYLHDIIKRKDFAMVTCPFHKDGMEMKPACSVVLDNNEKNITPGSYHCFACGAKGKLKDIVNMCFDKNIEDDFGSEWLIENYSDELIEDTSIQLDLISLDKPKQIVPDINNYDFSLNNPGVEYLKNKRHILEEVSNYFHIGYDNKTNSVVFPINDDKGNLTMVTKRSVNSHYFDISSGIEKPVYLLDEIIKNNYTKVIVCESQINALTCWSYGCPAIALIGTGSEYQMNILNRSGIRDFILMFDGDLAGKHGAMRFKDKINNSCLVREIILPDNKDVNDLTYQEFLYYINSRKDLI